MQILLCIRVLIYRQLWGAWFPQDLFLSFLRQSSLIFNLQCFSSNEPNHDSYSIMNNVKNYENTFRKSFFLCGMYVNIYFLKLVCALNEDYGTWPWQWIKEEWNCKYRQPWNDTIFPHCKFKWKFPVRKATCKIGNDS